MKGRVGVQVQQNAPSPGSETAKKLILALLFWAQTGSMSVIAYGRSKFPRRVDEELIVATIVHFAFQRFDREHNAFFGCQAPYAVALGLLADGLFKCENQRIATMRNFKREKFLHALPGIAP